MKNLSELKKSLSNGEKLIWKDPSPIDGNDYTITWIEEIKEDDFNDRYPILIQYGNGSEAYVFLHEIKKLQNKNKSK